MRFSMLCIAIVCAGSTSMAQFTATMKNVVSGNERIYQVYCDGENYRYEFTEDGQPGVVIVKPWKNQTIIMMPDKKYWFETTCDDIKSRMNDPVQAAYWFKQTGKEEIEGKEKIGNYMCERKALYQGDNKVFLVWHSPDLNFPVRIENLYDKNTHMDLVDINADWLSHKSYFYVPPGYTKVDEKMRPIVPVPPPPTEWTEMELEMPVNRVCKRGESFIIDITDTKNYTLKAINNSENPAKFIRSVWKNGAELPDGKQGPLKYRTRRIFSAEKYSNVFYWKEGEQVHIDIHEGELQLEVEPEKRPIN